MSKRKLLLADDSITIQKVVNLTFADEGIEVISVGDGDSAMRKFDEFMPDLVMADVNMPGLSGYEVCSIIKRTEETQNIPVILLVGSFEPFDEAEAKKAGADDFLTKPFQSIRQLVNKVTDLLNQGGRTPTEAASTENPPPVVDGFADTLEFEKQIESPTEIEKAPENVTEFEFRQLAESAANFESGEEISSEFGDAGMDDEMIEASPANDYVSGFDRGYQRETTIDYAKTQPLNAEELQGFDLGARDRAEEERAPQSAADENHAYFAERTEAGDPPSFDEEARKLSDTQNYEDEQSYEEAEKRSEVISETEPDIDYYLPAEPNFEKEVSDGETLAPDISYAPDEDPREADFSQAPEEDQSQGEAAGEETTETSAEQPKTSVAEETRLREVSEGAEAMPEAEIDLSGVGAAFEKPAGEREIEEDSPQNRQTEQSPEQQAEAEETRDEEAKTAEGPVVEAEEAPAPETKIEEAPQEKAQNEPEREVWTQTPTDAFSPPALDFDDGDLLELPPLVEETGIRPQPKPQPLVVPEIVPPAPPVAEPDPKITVTRTVAESEITLSFPPELIEAIAQKVAEKISAKTLTEVLPQITELVIKKLAEENRENKK